MNAVHNQDLPFVSVIMPVRNEEAFIERSLCAVFAQDYPHERLEILIADGMSTDRTRDLIQTAIPQTDIPLTVIDNLRQIVPTGMNLATRAARGDIIVRVDGHCEIRPDYINKCVEHLKADNIDAVGGIIDTISATPTSSAIALAMSSLFGVGGSAFRSIKNKSLFVDTVPFPAYTRRAVEAAGDYDEEMVRNQDDEYNFRLRKLGFTILLSPDIRSSYYSRSSLKSLWRQYFQYGYWKVRVMQKHPAQMSVRQFVPPTFLLALAGSLLLSAALGRLWIGSILVTAYLLANITASLWVSIKAGRLFIFRLPIIFTILHFSYGSGFLKGLIVFRKHWRARHRD